MVLLVNLFQFGGGISVILILNRYLIQKHQIRRPNGQPADRICFWLNLDVSMAIAMYFLLTSKNCKNVFLPGNLSSVVQIYNILLRNMFYFPKTHELQSDQSNQKQEGKCLANEGPFFITHGSFKELGNLKNQKNWTSEENVKYVIFIEHNSQKMRGKDHRALWKLYECMSKFIKTRNYRQCKLHHQKLLEQHKDIEAIVRYLTNKNLSFYQNMKSVQSQIQKYDQEQLPVKNMNKDPILTDSSYKQNLLHQQNKEGCVDAIKVQNMESCSQFLSKWTLRFRNLEINSISA